MFASGNVKRFFGFILLMVLAGNGVISGQVLSLPGSTPVSRLEQDYRYNPAAFILLDSLTWGGVALRYNSFGGEHLYSLSEGNEGYFVRADAGGYKINPGKGIYSGAALWETGVNKGVRWTNVRDAELLYPYLVADSLGGDYHHERYGLEGSWAMYAGKGIYGLRVGYLGEMAYRLRDPRPKNTVSELTLNPGAMWMSDDHYWGAFVKYVFYRQHLTTKIEEPYRKDMFYVLTGMGLYDYYFSAIGQSFARYYRSHEYQGGVQFGYLPQGVSGMAAYSRRKMEVEESDYRKPFKLTTDQVEIGLKWQKNLSRSVLVLRVNGDRSWRNGTERTFEKVKTDEQTGVFVWKLLTESKKHRLEQTNGHIGLLLQRKVSDRQLWWYGLDGFWREERERYLLPEYGKKLADLTGTVNVGFRRDFGDKQLEVEFRGGYKKNVSSSLASPAVQTVVQGMLLPEYAYRCQDYYTGRLKLEYRLPVYRQAMLAFYLDTHGNYAGSDRYRWQTEAGVRVDF